jgi:hypothetical protein
MRKMHNIACCKLNCNTKLHDLSLNCFIKLFCMFLELLNLYFMFINLPLKVMVSFNFSLFHINNIRIETVEKHLQYKKVFF